MTNHIEERNRAGFRGSQYLAFLRFEKFEREIEFLSRLENFLFHRLIPYQGMLETRESVSYMNSLSKIRSKYIQ